MCKVSEKITHDGANIMSNREVPFYEDAVCDNCGRPGAYDFISASYCAICIGEDDKGELIPDKVFKNKVNYCTNKSCEFYREGEFCPWGETVKKVIENNSKAVNEPKVPEYYPFIGSDETQKISKTIQVTDKVWIDIDEKGRAVGLEVLY